MHADRSHDHDRHNQGGADRAEQAQRHQQATADFTRRGGCGEEAPGTEAHRFEKSGRACQAVPAEPAEELLRAMGRHHQPEHEPNQNQSCIHVASPVLHAAPGWGATVTTRRRSNIDPVTI